MTAAIVAAVGVHSAAAVALVATVVVIVLNHAAHLALKATEAVIASKIVRLHHALKVALRVAAISAPRAASNRATISVANNAALRLAVAKVVSSPVAINALTTVAVTASKRATIATAVHHAHLAAVTTLVAVQAIALHLVAPRSLVQATSSPTMLAVMLHPSALAPKY
jgi:hypothetical protein